MIQEQFLEVIDRDEAERRFSRALDLRPLSAETIALDEALGRVLAGDVIAPIDVPGFDRSNVDGFAVITQDTFEASEEHPRRLRLNAEAIAPGESRAEPLQPGTATAIATGAGVPRGADSVVMIEFTDATGHELLVRRAVAPGANIAFAGTDVGRGETVLRQGDLLTSRDTAVLAALGFAAVSVVRRPRVAIVSTGNEIIAPGARMSPGLVYDSNATVLADAVREFGGDPLPRGIVRDDEVALEQTIRQALSSADLILLSGGTSKGAGDVSYRVVAKLGPPGILAHGVALKPGKPLCLAAVQVERGDEGRTIPVVVLPGFPASALFTFHEFVAPVIRKLAGRRESPATMVRARLPFRINSERGRTEYVLVTLVATVPTDEFGAGATPTHPPPESLPSTHHSPFTTHPSPRYMAYPVDKSSGSVTAFGRADGYLNIPRQTEYLSAGEEVDVRLLSGGLRPVDLVVIGSHCIGLDYLLGKLQDRGIRSKFLAVGSTGGLLAARRGECDLAGIHMLDPETNRYNAPYLDDSLTLIAGYGRLQGIVYRPGDRRFEGFEVTEAVRHALDDPQCTMVNRNRGSGTRVLIDRLIGNARPRGYLTEAKSHHAVVAAIEQGRADWGVAIANVAQSAGLAFLPLQAEQYDFVAPCARISRASVHAFISMLNEKEIRTQLAGMGFEIAIPPGA
jgi:putative molybdopterin biosynthesis protein